MFGKNLYFKALKSIQTFRHSDIHNLVVLYTKNHVQNRIKYYKLFDMTVIKFALDLLQRRLSLRLIVPDNLHCKVPSTQCLKLSRTIAKAVCFSSESNCANIENYHAMVKFNKTTPCGGILSGRLIAYVCCPRSS